MSSKIQVKRGDTLRLVAVLPVDFPDRQWTVACTAVAKGGAGTQHALTASIETREVRGVSRRAVIIVAPSTQTAAWAPTKMVADIQFTDATVEPPEVVSSKDFTFEVIANRTGS